MDSKTLARLCAAFRPASKTYRVALGILMGALVLAGSGGAAAGPLKAAASGNVYHVSWSITASGNGSSVSGSQQSSWQQSIDIHGSALVKEDPITGGITTFPFGGIIHDNYWSHTTDICQDESVNRYITDPERWIPGPDPFWNVGGTFTPIQRANGSWYIIDPFYLTFSFNGQLTRYHAYRTDDDYRDTCGGSGSFFNTFTLDQAFYTLVFDHARDLEGDSSGTLFTRDETYTVGAGDYQLSVQYSATVSLDCAASAANRPAGSGPFAGPVCGCQSRPEGQVIAASDPIVNTHEVSLNYTTGSEMDPDLSNTLTVDVTCEGRPLSNAEVEVSLKPEERSGAHEHDDAAPERPRGYLNGTPISRANPSIKLITGANGQASIQVEAGKDIGSATRGIAGLYVTKARSTRFKQSETSLYVRARVKDLQALPAGANYVFTESPQAHPQNFYGTQLTLNALTQFSADFTQRQVDHNGDLAFYGESAWPIVKVNIFDMSLKDGGLYDVDKHSRWRTPYNLHLRGSDVFMTPDHIESKIFPGADVKQVEAWFTREFKKLGSQYGNWFTDFTSPWNLAVNQVVSSQRRNRVPDASSSAPDLASVVILSDPATRFSAGAGQSVTYTVGVENLPRGTSASNVVLTATLPGGLNFVSANPAASYMAGANRPVWTMGVLTATAVPRVFDIVTQIGNGVAPGTVLTVSAQASTSDADADLSNNTAQSFGLSVQPPGPDLVVSSDLDAAAMTVGQPVTFTVSVDNAGNATAASTAFTLTLPVSVTLTSANPPATSAVTGGYRWDLGDLPRDASQTITLTVALDPLLAAQVSFDPEAQASGNLTYTLRAGSPTPDIDPASDVQQVVVPVTLPGPDTAVWMGVLGAAPGTLSVTQVVTYSIEYGNFGNQVAQTSTLTLSLSSGLSVLGAQPVAGRTATSTLFGGGVLGWDLGDLRVGEEGVIQVRVRVDAEPPEGSLVIATIRSEGRDLTPADNVAIEERRGATTARALFLPLIKR